MIGRPRCNVPERLKEFGCSPEKIHTTPLESMTLLEDSDFQDMEADHTPIQLRPQRVNIRIPPYSKMTIPIRYRLAKYVSLIPTY